MFQTTNQKMWANAIQNTPTAMAKTLTNATLAEGLKIFSNGKNEEQHGQRPQA